jgi:hypothetical protein
MIAALRLGGAFAQNMIVNPFNFHPAMLGDMSRSNFIQD